jgi:hypothetical protein
MVNGKSHPGEIPPQTPAAICGNTPELTIEHQPLTM